MNGKSGNTKVYTLKEKGIIAQFHDAEKFASVIDEYLMKKKIFLCGRFFCLICNIFLFLLSYIVNAKISE